MRERRLEPLEVAGLVVFRALAVPTYLAHLALIGWLLLTARPLGIATLVFRVVGSYAWLYERVVRRWAGQLGRPELHAIALPRWIPPITGLWGHLVWGALLLGIATARGWRAALAVAATALVGERGVLLPARYVMQRTAARCAVLADAAARAGDAERAADLARLAAAAGTQATALPLLAYLDDGGPTTEDGSKAPSVPRRRVSVTRRPSPRRGRR
jgi:hypothetical protein